MYILEGNYIMSYKNTYQVEIEQYGLKDGMNALLKKHPEITSLTPLISKEEQKHSGDFSYWHNEDLEVKTIEVKTEERFTGNFYFEWFDNVSTNRNGWVRNLTKCSALLYCFKDEQVGYYFSSWPIMRLFLYNAEQAKKYPMIQSNKCKTQKITPVGLIVPIADCIGLCERIDIE